MKNFVIFFLGGLMAGCLAVDPSEFETCQANKQCSQLRGKIEYDWASVSAFQRHLFTGKSWIIKPEGNVKTSITIAFKDFDIKQNLYIAANSEGRIRWKQLSGKLGNKIELIATEVTSLTLYIRGDEKGSFKAYFYVGCSVLTSSSGEISFPSVDDVIGVKSTCWIIKSMGMVDLSRMYFTLRDVYLIGDAKISVQELHTNRMIAVVNETAPYDIYGSNTVGQETFLVDLSCGEKKGTCSKFGNIFSLSYYALNTKDVDCIETQRQCALDPWLLPESVCSQSCPTLDDMIEEEYSKEGPVFLPQAPIVKSGAFPTAMEIAKQVEQHANRTATIINQTLAAQSTARTRGEEESEEGHSEEDEEKEDEEEMEEIKKEEEEIEKEEEEIEKEIEEEEEEDEDEQDVRLTPKPKPQPIRCQLRGKFCKCLRTKADARRYCFSKRKCKSFGFCAIGCIWSRIIICAKMTSSASIELLSG